MLPDGLELLLNELESWRHTFLFQGHESAVFLDSDRYLFDGVLHVRLEFWEGVRFYVFDTTSVFCL